MVAQDITSRVKSIRFDSTDNPELETEDLQQTILSFVEHLRYNDMCIANQALVEILNDSIHISLASLSNLHKANISVRFMLALIDMYLRRRFDMEMNTIRYILQTVADSTDRCM
jgi:hypothetical protein